MADATDEVEALGDAVVAAERDGFGRHARRPLLQTGAADYVNVSGVE
jgi:hypothetical protein